MSLVPSYISNLEVAELQIISNAPVSAPAKICKWRINTNFQTQPNKSSSIRIEVDLSLYHPPSQPFK